jgi:tetratricopeptide (TPR) repeat protein
VVADNVDSAQKALSYAYRSQSVMVIARQQFHLGFVFLWSGNLREAETMLRQALENVEELGDAWLHTQCLVYLTILCRLQGRIDEVQNLLASLSERSRQIGNNMYIAVSQAMAAWLHYRAGKWPRAQAQAQRAIATWRGYPFQWLAHWILLDLALKQARVQDALSSARAMLDAGQQRLPDDVQALLDTAVSAWDAGDKIAAGEILERASQKAQQLGYL